MADSQSSRGNKLSISKVERALAGEVDEKDLKKTQRRSRRKGRDAEIEKLLSDFDKMSDAEKAGLIAVNKDNAILSSRVTELEAQLKASQALASTHEKDLKAARKELASTREKVDDLETEIGPLRNLQKEFEARCDEVDEANSKLWMKAGAKEAKKELEACEALLLAEQAKVAKFTKDLIELEGLRVKAERVEKLEAELATEKALRVSEVSLAEEAKSSLRGEINELKSKAEVIRLEKVKFEAELIAKSALLKTIEEKLKTMEKLHASASGLHKESQHNLARAMEMTSTLTAQLSTAQAEIESLTEKVNQGMASVNTETEQELKGLRERVKKLEGELERLHGVEETLVTFERQAREAGEKATELKQALTASKSEVTKLTINRTSLQAKLLNLNMTVTGIKTANATQAEDIKALKAQLES